MSYLYQLTGVWRIILVKIITMGQSNWGGVVVSGKCLFDLIQRNGVCVARSL